MHNIQIECLGRFHTLTLNTLCLLKFAAFEDVIVYFSHQQNEGVSEKQKPIQKLIEFGWNMAKKHRFSEHIFEKAFVIFMTGPKHKKTLESANAITCAMLVLGDLEKVFQVYCKVYDVDRPLNGFDPYSVVDNLETIFSVTL